MASFDVVSELDLQEVRNAVDQAAREVGNRYDFKDTSSVVELGDGEIRLESASDDRLAALRVILEEKLVRRKVSLKAVSFGEVAESSGGRARTTATLQAGISGDRARAINKYIKGLGLKGIQSQTQGEQLRVISKKRDQLQTVIAELKGHDFGLPLQFTNFRD